MANLSSVARSVYADLLRLLKDDMIANVRGSLVSKARGDKVYWYAAEKIGTNVKFWYIGLDSPEMRHRIEQMKALHQQAAARRAERARLTRLLRAEGLTPVDRSTGGLLLAMAKVGTFRLGGTLVGTHAFRLMEGELGVTLPLDGVATTADLDIAQFQRLSVVLEDAVQPSLAETFSALRFDPVQGLDGDSVWRWRQGGDTGMMVEFLTPSFGAEEGIRTLPALGVKARALQHLNYLISDPINAVALYRDGILVQIPRPEKFAIHKLIVADRRRDGAASFKAEKDRQQAALIIATMAEDRPSDVWDAYVDAMARGPRWRERIERTLARMPDTRAALNACQDS